MHLSTLLAMISSAAAVALADEAVYLVNCRYRDDPPDRAVASRAAYYADIGMARAHQFPSDLSIEIQGGQNQPIQWVSNSWRNFPFQNSGISFWTYIITDGGGINSGFATSRGRDGKAIHDWECDGASDDAIFDYWDGQRNAPMRCAAKYYCHHT